MNYRFLADCVVVIHGAFVLFVVFGGLLALRWPRAAPIHLPAAVWGAAVEFCGWICPLTPLENRLRRLGGGEGYRGGWVEHYLVPLIYPAGLTEGRQFVLGAIVVVLNALVYGIVWRRRTRQRGINKDGQDERP